jgi:hypothetical protein
VTKNSVRLLVDDLDGSAADETVVFGLEGESFAIELNAEHALQLRESLALFVRHGRRIGGRSTPLSNTVRVRALHAKAYDNRVREWARATGAVMGDDEPISTDLWIKYHEAGA